MTFWETVERGEYVMIALAVLLIFIILIWCIKTARLRKSRKTYPALLQRIRDHVTEGDLENAQLFSQAFSSPGAKIVSVGLRGIGKPIAEISSDIEMAGEIEKGEMNGGARWLSTIAVISPLLGLGGTLVGIIDRLRDLGEMGLLVDMSMLCHAIAPTIVTTVAGLGVGIFSLIAYTCLESSIDISRRDLDKVKADFIDLLNTPT